MAQSDRERLLATALALPDASPEDFFGDRRPPPDADPSHLKIIADTALRTKLVETRVAEGLQSPKGPQRIASILRIYPNFDAPPKSANGRAPRAPSTTARAASSGGGAPTRGLPTVAQMERLIARYRDVERDVALELSSEADERVAQLKRSLVDLDGPELEAAYSDLGRALSTKRALEAQIRHETFARLERDNGFAERVFLRVLARV